MWKCLFFCTFLLLGTCLSACVSESSISVGLQEEYRGLNPALVLAVPAFVLLDPTESNGKIDNSILFTQDIKNKIQKKIMKSFEKQPNINGYSFDAVEQAWKKTDTAKKMSSALHHVEERMSSQDPRERALVTDSCAASTDFLGFYRFCLSKENTWLQSLHLLSSSILNADTALLVFIHDLQATSEQNRYQIQGRFSVLLVDTNNGKLIWGNRVDGLRKALQPADPYPSWEALLDESFGPAFWKDFPGRMELDGTK